MLTKKKRVNVSFLKMNKWYKCKYLTVSLVGKFFYLIVIISYKLSCIRLDFFRFFCTKLSPSIPCPHHVYMLCVTHLLASPLTFSFSAYVGSWTHWHQSLIFVLCNKNDLENDESENVVKNLVLIWILLEELSRELISKKKKKKTEHKRRQVV